MAINQPGYTVNLVQITQAILDDYSIWGHRLASPIEPHCFLMMLPLQEGWNATLLSAPLTRHTSQAVDISKTTLSGTPIHRINDLTEAAHQSLKQAGYSPTMSFPIPGDRYYLGTLTFASTGPIKVAGRDRNRLELLRLLFSYLWSLPLEDIDFTRRVLSAIASKLSEERRQAQRTQRWLADQLGVSCSAASRWERGVQFASLGLLLEWYRALEVLVSPRGATVATVDLTPQILDLLKKDPAKLQELSPGKFEAFVADRLDRMGFNVTLCGGVNRKDGGIDVIATPKDGPVPYIIATQVKHRSTGGRVGRPEVARMLEWKGTDISFGLLVTNSEFTSDARWLATQVGNRSFLRLRGFDDLQNWLQDNFEAEQDWREIPDRILVAPGIEIPVPKPQLILPRG